MDPPVPGAGRGRPGQVVGSGTSAEQGVGGYGLNVVASNAGYDDAPDLVEGWTAAIVEGYRGAECADRPAATRVLLDLCPGQDAGYVEPSWSCRTASTYRHCGGGRPLQDHAGRDSTPAGRRARLLEAGRAVGSEVRI